MVTISEVHAKIEMMTREGVSPVALAFVRLLFRSGSRVGALLAIEPTDILPNDLIIVRQGKGSNPLFVTIYPDEQFFRDCAKYKKRPFSGLNYTYIYRLLKGYGLTQQKMFGENSAVTALGRKLVAQGLEEIGEDINTIATALGHRSSNSTGYYLKNAPKYKKKPLGVLNSPSQDMGLIMINKNGVIRMRKHNDR